MTNLDLKEMYWSNILSYGDYENHFNFENFGVASVSGINGSGKSSMMTALLWCLSGKTIRNKVAGDKILNWYTGKNGYVSLITKDGYNITRSRKLAGQDELIIKYNGEDISLSTNQNVQQWVNQHFKFDFDIFISSVFFGQPSESLLEIPEQRRKLALERFFGIDKFNTIAQTAKDKLHDIELQQADLRAKIDYLNRDISSINQSIADNSRLSSEWEDNRVKLINEYNDKIATINTQIDELPNYDVAAIRGEWDKYNASIKFANDLRTFVTQLSNDIYKHNSDVKYLRDVAYKINGRLGQINYINMDELAAQHAASDVNNRLRSKLLSRIRGIDSELGILLGNINSNKRTISNWEGKGGTICVSCEQVIDPEHINNSIVPLMEELDRQIELRDVSVAAKQVLTTKLEAIPELSRIMSIDEADRNNQEFDNLMKDKDHKNAMISETCQVIDMLNGKLDILKQKLAVEEVKNVVPSITLDMVNNNNHTINAFRAEISNYENRISELMNNENSYGKLMESLLNKLVGVNSELSSNTKLLIKLDTAYSHIKYIYNSYNDRKKIKGYVLSEYIDILNKKIDYYADIFQCTTRVKFNQSLSIESDKWDADYFSGGERKRLDVAIMLAMGDVYNILYGPQCNIRVFDEVDGSLDDVGTQKFAEIINDMIQNNEYLDTIFVISHKGDLFDAFQRKIKIVKDQEFSRIDMVE